MEEYFSFQATNNFSSKHGSITTKKRLTHDQLHLLETSFITNPKLEGERKQELASKLGLPPKQVAVWYQNKRARCKTEAIELDHKAIQLQLQNVLAHNKQLQSEVRRLTHKLNQAHHLLFPASNPSAASASASAPSFNVLASSSLNSPARVNSIWENADSIWKNAEVLPIMEELYACLLE